MVVIAIVASLSSPNIAAQEACTLPQPLPSPKIQAIDCTNDISPDYYALSLSWSPTYCETVAPNSPKNRFQCAQNHFNFVVHGLWGQNSQAEGKCDHPRNCGRSLVSDSTVRNTLCIVPGVDLIQGEWQKHGTCTDMAEDAYFAKTRELWETLKKPDMAKIVDDKNRTTAGAIVQAFVEANKANGLASDAVAVAVQVGSKNKLKEVYICYDLNYKYTTCKTGKTPLNQVISVTPPKAFD